MSDTFATLTHPEAKLRSERERDEITWGVGFTSPRKAWIVNLNGDTVAGPMASAMAREIVRLHNQAIQAI